MSSHAHEEAVRIANELYQQNPDWVTFFREVLGVDGVVNRLFPTAKERSEFEQSGTHHSLMLMLSNLRQAGDQEEGKEPTRVITVRLPKSLHESLRAEAHCHRISMNKLCISKLLQVVDPSLAPAT